MRAVSLAALLAVTVGLLLRWGGVVGLPDDYGAAQSRSGPWLAERSGRWADWHVAAVRDIALYVPFYLVYGLVAVAIVVGRRRRGRGLLFVTLAGTALADVAETVLFRTSLSRLRGNPAADVADLARATQVMTGLKVVGALATVGLLVFHVVYREPGSGSSVTKSMRRSTAPTRDGSRSA